MTQCFKDQTCDTIGLNQSTVPLSECKKRFVEVYGCMTEVTDVPILTCECIWRIFQREAEEIVAPGGVLIADPIARNRAINAAYARLWLHDERFQWAGLAAFASKQVGCGLLHATESIERIEDEFTARKKWLEVRSKGSYFELPGDEENQRRADYDEVSDKNLIPVDLRLGEPQTIAQKQFQYVYDMLALGNTTLFLDIFPLHAFYKKRGLEELKVCIGSREKISGHPKFPVLWPVGKERLTFGKFHAEILEAFIAIEAGDIAKSVELFASHEQKNILQPTIYEDRHLVWLLRGNHMSYVTDLPSGVAQAIELTLTSQCQRVDDERTVVFGRNPFADLSDIDQRMTFVLEAAKRFDGLLKGPDQYVLTQSINEIALSGEFQ